MERIIFLGTSASVATRERDNTSLLLQSGREKILIDCPGSLVKKLKTISVDFKSICRIFLTHPHPDHVYGIIALLHSQYRLKNTVHIYAHPETLKIVKKLRKIFSIEDLTKYPRIVYHAVKGDIFYESFNFKVGAFKVRHVPSSLGFKFLFRRNRQSCVFSGDACPGSEIIKQSKYSDFLIHDCFSPEKIFKRYPLLNKMHTSSHSLGKIASQAKVKTVIPIHFAGEVRYSMNEIKREIKDNFSGRVIIPRDLMSLTL